MTDNRTRRAVARQIRERLAHERDDARTDRDAALALLREVHQEFGYLDGVDVNLSIRIDALLSKERS